MQPVPSAKSVRRAKSLRLSLEALDIPRWMQIYGEFTTWEMITADEIGGLAKESGHIRPEIVQFINKLAEAHPITPLLLPGEYGRVVPAYVQWLGIEPADVVTAGIGDDVDFSWNFEDDPPSGLGSFSLIVSQAMLEHLLDPYKHVRDLYALLADGGSLILHTHPPGRSYHRHPIDCCRFYPDWFEEIATRLGAHVTGRFVGDLRIMYQYTKAS